VIEGGGLPRPRWGRFLAVALAGALLGSAGTYVLTRGPTPELAGSWTYAADLNDIQRQRVMYVQNFVEAEDLNIFLVSNDSEQPLAFAAVTPQDVGDPDPVFFCESSGWFESLKHGSKFDGKGLYGLGPSPRGLDRFAVAVVGSKVYVDPSEVIQGPPRFDPKPQPPIGTFCRGPLAGRPGFGEF
jgi:hypothetical protein